MGNMFGMFLFAFAVIRALQCEAVNFLKFKSAGRPVRPFEYLSTPILLITHAPCMHTCDAHVHHDITTLPVFALHLCHIGMRWHDIIGVHVGGPPCHHGLHHMGMT